MTRFTSRFTRAFTLVEIPVVGERKRAAFTLVELLVVIGIIALLISILLPAMSRARETAKTVQCSAQLRQIGQAIFSYAVANRGLTPAWSQIHYYPNDVDNPTDRPDLPEWSGPGWVVLLERYIGQKPDGKIWTCPNFPAEEPAVTVFFEARWMRCQDPILRSIQMSKPKMQSKFIMVGECTGQIWYPPPFGNRGDPNDDIDKDDAPGPPDEPGGQPCLTFFGDDGGFNMHRAGNNLLFYDGHVATFKKYEPQGFTYHPHKLLNFEEIRAE